jgi:hypothetical protein
MNFLLSTLYIVSHEFGFCVPLFPLNLRMSFFFFISSLTQRSLNRELFNFNVYVGFPVFLWLLKSSFIPSWPDKMQRVISVI